MRKIEPILIDITEIVKVSKLSKNGLSAANISLLKNGKYKGSNPSYMARFNQVLKGSIAKLKELSEEIEEVLETVKTDI